MSAADLTLDGFLGGRVQILQRRTGYRAAIDPVFLAASVPATPKSHCLELGSGVGTAALCLAMRVPGVRVTGLEIDEELVTIAHRNAELNGCAERVEFVAGDLLDPPPALAPSSFDFVLLNPPFHISGLAGDPCATREGRAKLRDWLTCALAFAKPEGKTVLIHRADRLHEIVAIAGALEPRYGRLALSAKALVPRWGKPARRVLVALTKGGAKPRRPVSMLTLHEELSRFTKAANAVLRHGAAVKV